MRFQRLRLSGFKSFVEPAELRIEPGLTGVVGPNGCGKSNLLEALRWVMGASSAKAMRADGMDDVIFGGAASRPPRNHAEVSLQIDNAERRAPAQFNDHAVIEVVRRINRGAGSTYRINGVETRARDVQLLFADASTGANSPAMVRQGQISELIAAKPANRRRILEEAAGVAGLHARRHEAHMRLTAAEANLGRLDDVTREIEQALNRLKREARQAQAYRRLAAEIRTLEAAQLHASWAQAEGVMHEAQDELDRVSEAVEAGAREAASATSKALAASEALKPLREEAMVAAVVLQRLELEEHGLQREVDQAGAQQRALEGELSRNADDQVREAQVARDASTTLARLIREQEEVEAAIADAPARLPGLEQALAAAQARRETADAWLEAQAGELAAAAARRQSARDTLERAVAADRTAADRLAQAEVRLRRTREALDAARTQLVDLPAQQPEAEAARTRLELALEELKQARDGLEAAEQAHADASSAEALGRDAARLADDGFRRLRSEAQGLIQLMGAPTKGRREGPGFRPVLDQVTPAVGYEAAVAAAFGEDLDAGLDPAAPSFWAGGKVEVGGGPPWPAGATPLAAFVGVPDALAARLAMTALVAVSDGPRLQARLPTGARLVSPAGDLWRWDGFTMRADAPKPAARRLAQKARLQAIEAEIAQEAPRAAAANQAHAATVDQLRAREAELRIARQAPQAAEHAVADARMATERIAREAAQQEARGHALREAASRLSQEVAEIDEAVAAARDETELAESVLAEVQAAASQIASPDVDGALAEARKGLAQTRDGEARARSALEAERRSGEARRRRREALRSEITDWTRRGASADARSEALAAARERIDTALVQSRARPAELGTRRLQLLDAMTTAQARRDRAQDALALADAEGDRSDRAARNADQLAAESRERRAAAEARLGAARQNEAAARNQLREATGGDAADARRDSPLDEPALPTGAAAIELRLRDLRREREAIGAVNLRAEEDAQTHAQRLEMLLAERADLAAAIGKLRRGIETLNGEGRERLLAAFEVINRSFQDLFQTLFDGGQAELRLVESEDPLEAGLEIYACPPGKRLATMSLMSGGEQALTAAALILAVFLASPAPICVLDEVDAPLDDANVDRFCRLLDEMRRRTDTRFIAITHNPVTMSRMDRLFGVTMQERGVSRLVSVDLRQAEALAAQ